MKLNKIVSGVASLALSLTAFAGVGKAVPDNSMKAQAASSWRFDLGGNGAASGFTGVSASDGYNASRGYGFAQTNNVANVSAAGSGALSDAVQFKSTAGGNTFNVDLPSGLYEIKVTTGNTSRTSIVAEGMLQLMNLTGNNAVETFQIPVTDGQLNIRATEGRAGTAFSLSAIEITQLNTTGVMNPTVWICGDSTVANYYNTADSAQHGWGQFYGGYIKNTGYIVRNMAASGQYAKGFVDAGQFAPIETYGKPGDVYIIAIGINDRTYSNSTEYYNTVTDMVKRSKAKGMEVILVKQQGRRSDLNQSSKLGGRWFGGELDKIGREQSVQVVDLFNAWQDFGFSVGYNGMASYYATKADGTGDDLHQSKKGAQKLAEIMNSLVTIGNAEPYEPFVPEEGVSYMFKNVNSGLYMEVEGAKAEEGANVQQWGASAPAAHNTWTIKQATGNLYYIYSNLADGKTFLLNVEDGSRVSGGNINSAKNNGYSDQFYEFKDNYDGTVTILTRASRQACAVEVASASTNSGANIQQWEVNGNNCQKWIIEKADYTSQIVTTTTTAPEPVTTTTTTSAPVEHRIKKFPGNANCDSNVSMADAVLIMQSISNGDKYGEDGSDPTHITAQGKINADVDGNGSVTPADALFIQKVMLKLETLPEIEYEDVIPEPITTTTSADPYAGYYFAVDQTWSEGVIESANGGFTKTAGVGSSDKEGYINLDNNDTSNITFTVNVEADGNYMTHIRFANGSTADRSMMISVNGGTDMTWLQSFPGTGDWTTWAEYGIVLPLKAGKNTIKMVSHVAGQGGPNLDYITLTLTDEPFAQPYDPNEVKPGTVSDRPAIYIAGDSTAQSYSSRYAPQQGWGYYAGNYYTDNVTVVNKSIGGRSSKKFYDEGRFKEITDVLKEGDFVFIQFAINDAGKTNADRYAPTCGNVDNPSSGSYEWYMTQFIKDTLAKKATPVLMSCTLSGKSYSNGKFVASYTNYTDACKKLASKYNVPFVDVNSAIVDHYNSIGYDKAKSYHLAGAVSGSTDLTHYCEEGANKIAGVIANAVKKANISGLSEYVK
jgi:lysophospholipase L1-like esterase